MVISGYHTDVEAKWQPWFHQLWWDHNIAPIQASGLETVTIFATQNAIEPSRKFGHWLRSLGDLGHCDDVISGRKKVFCPHCPASWIAGAWLAYMNECDLIYIEQDCLCFGPWLEQMYKDLITTGMVFGNGKYHGGSSTCLFLIQHRFIPEWTNQYIREGHERVSERIAEFKMRDLRQRYPERYNTLSFGYDTDRPFNMEDKVFYLQKISAIEMMRLMQAGLVETKVMPAVERFSNH